MKYGEIWMVDFDPSVGHEFKKIRPAVIIQSDQLQTPTNCLTIMPITSNVHNCSVDDVHVGITPKNGLYKPSLISVAEIMSYDKIRFRKKIGVLEVETMEKIKQYLTKHFNLV